MSAELTIQLSDEQLEILAGRVAEILRVQSRRPLVDAATVAAALGVSRDTIYEHAKELGGVQLGDGKRPRWRFDLEAACATWSRSPDLTPTLTRRRRRKPARAGLLPVHGDAT